jgi:flagellin-like protein
MKGEDLKILKNTKGLSPVVTTLLILVVAVILAGAVTIYAISTTKTNMQQEDITITEQHIWHGPATPNAQACLILSNTGGRDVYIEKIQVRGVDVDWSNVYVDRESSYNTTDYGTYVSDGISGSTLTIGSRTYYRQSNPIDLKSGDILLIYLAGPDEITVLDIGKAITITVYTASSIYSVTAVVETSY